MMKILVMGLPGSGKTTMASKLAATYSKHFATSWFNADEVRSMFNDWDFSAEGRIRQAKRLRQLADDSGAKIVICDFVAALKEQRDIFGADITIWMDTIKQGRYEDTNAAFEPPTEYDMRITERV